MRLISALVIAAGLLSTPALASGGLFCSGETDGVSFDLRSGVTHGMGGPLFNFEGEVSIEHTPMAPDLAHTVFDKSNVVQYWFDGDELNLLLYKERGPEEVHGYVELEIRTKAIDEGTFSGSYEISVFDVISETAIESFSTGFSGDAECGAD